jgi:acetolactate synthase I/II/III large subunit
MSFDGPKLAEEARATCAGFAFGIPGGGKSLDLIDALLSVGVRFQRTNFEGSAAIMAGITGRLSGRSGLAICIKGPGLANLIPGLAVCKFENLPVVALSEAYEPESQAFQMHKRINHKELTRSVVKASGYLSRSDGTLTDATNYAMGETPGPVHLDMVEARGDVRLHCQPVELSESAEAKLNKVRASKRPVLVVGSLATRLKIEDRLEGLEVPVFSTVAAKGVLDERKDNAAGIFTGCGIGLAPESRVVDSADLLIGIGLRNAELLRPKEECSIPFLNFDVTPNENQDTPWYPNKAAAGSWGDGLFRELEGKSWGLEEVAVAREALHKHFRRSDFLPAQVYYSILNLFGTNVCFVVDTGNFCIVAEHVWATDSPEKFLSSANGRYMGSAIPMAIAAALVRPKLPTIVAVGDGGIGMFVSELELAVRYKLPLLIVLLSDGGFGSIISRALAKNHSLDPLVIPDRKWVKVFEGMGIPSILSANMSEFSAALVSWKPEDGPLFLECRFDPEQYRSIVQGIRQ